MDRSARRRCGKAQWNRKRTDAPGIVIADGGIGLKAGLQQPRVRAFIYGEEAPASPTLPFGRWKDAS